MGAFQIARAVRNVCLAGTLVGAALMPVSAVSQPLKKPADRLVFSTPALPPAAFSRFCDVYPRECEVSGTRLRPTRLVASAARLQTIVTANHETNASIRSTNLMETSTDAGWTISPPAGNCHDFAVTKRHKLIQQGIAAAHLLLAEVVTAYGTHHLVLVVRTTRGDVVLDNLSDAIRPWTRTGYRWVRVQTPRNPWLWSRVAISPPAKAS